MTARERQDTMVAWMRERTAHVGLTATELVDVAGDGLYEGTGRYDRCFDDLKRLEQRGLVSRRLGRPARWYLVRP